jgi:NAD(P)-dependent dehydrogenase (short-subunit alcohol dehydrogenase family)
MKLKDQVMLVTGGGRAIGRRIALRAASEGADVVVLGLGEQNLRRTAEEIGAAGRRALAVVADVSCEQQVIEAVATAHREMGRIDVLVNNAGITGPTAALQAIRREDWDEVLAVNLTGAFLCSKAVLPEMLQRRSGKIINISSVAGKLPYPLRAAYAASKWGLIGLSLTLAKEVGPHNLCVNAICPGPVEGPRMQQIISNRAAQLGQPFEQVEQAYLSASVLGRMVREDDVAATVVFLASPDADNITGQAIDVSAGYAL